MVKSKKRSLFVSVLLIALLCMSTTFTFAASGTTKVIGTSTKYSRTVTKTAGDANKGYVMCKATLYYKTAKAKNAKSNPCGIKVVTLSKNTVTNFDKLTKARIKLSTFNGSWAKPYKSGKKYVVKTTVTWKWPDEGKPVTSNFTFNFN